MAQIQVHCTGCNTHIQTIDSAKAADLPEAVFCKRCRARMDQMAGIVAQAEAIVSDLTANFMSELKTKSREFVARLAADPKAEPKKLLADIFGK